MISAANSQRRQPLFRESRLGALAGLCAGAGSRLFLGIREAQRGGRGAVPKPWHRPRGIILPVRKVPDLLDF
jgi:hypothetical protein